MSNCLNPTACWFIGTAPCKRDGAISPVVTFSPNKALEYLRSCGQDDSMLDAIGHSVPCGKCINCLVKKRKDMSVRITKEAVMTNGACCFLTLTYNDDHLERFWPQIGDNRPCLVKKDVQDFMKRFRRHLEYHGIVSPGKLRYFAVGEYGPSTHRPHYHIIIFGWKPSDITLQSVSKSNHLLYTSKLVGECWKFGFHTVEDFSPQAARYCARYVTKKLTNTHCSALDGLPDEFFLASKMQGGIGAPWFDCFGRQACETGITVIDSGNHMVQVATPAYFFDRLRKQDLDFWLSLRAARQAYAIEHATEERAVDSSIRNMLYSQYLLEKERRLSTL